MELENLLHQLAALQEELAVSDLSETLRMLAELAAADRAAGIPRSEPLLIHRTGHIKLYIYQEPTQHKRPHFHIVFKNEHNASYAIDDFSRLVGEMPKRYEAIMLKWARRNQSLLHHHWHQIQLGETGESLSAEHGVRILPPPQMPNPSRGPQEDGALEA